MCLTMFLFCIAAFRVCFSFPNATVGHIGFKEFTIDDRKVKRLNCKNDPVTFKNQLGKPGVHILRAEQLLFCTRNVT